MTTRKPNGMQSLFAKKKNASVLFYSSSEFFSLAEACGRSKDLEISKGQLSDNTPW